ncbi:MAG: Ada metal-binding domain-containing protein [Promethearchaeota archaeon]|jgi:AraC family transcriptional regulator of adaptative response/methylated-DNA-[protein]-cysteine methyltransferase
MSYPFDFMYEKIVNKESHYNGKFFICVKTTKIFCLPSCKAKTPFKKNVEFVYSAERALEKGYRPCKRCHPLNSPDFFPDWLNTIEEFLNKNLNRRIADIELAGLVNIDISTIRRYFKKKYAMSIKEYHRIHRLKKAEKHIKKGIEIEKVASLTGYHSTKGFKLAFKKQYGDIDFEKI